MVRLLLRVSAALRRRAATNQLRSLTGMCVARDGGDETWERSTQPHLGGATSEKTETKRTSLMAVCRVRGAAQRRLANLCVNVAIVLCTLVRPWRNSGNDVRLFKTVVDKTELWQPPHCKHRTHMSSARLACMKSPRLISSLKTRSCLRMIGVVLCNRPDFKSVSSTMHRRWNIS